MESTPEQVAEGLVVVRVLGRVLEKLVASNANHAEHDQGQVTKFHALKAPSIGILQYLERIHKYASCSTECFILALIYIDRLIQGNNFLLTELNVHRVAITSILLAAKFFDDAYYNNAYYAKVGGVLVSEMNRLEVEFLFRINFSLHVSPELYNKYHAQLSQHVVCGNPMSPPAVFVPPAPVTELEPQVKLISCDHGENNPSVIQSHMHESSCTQNSDEFTQLKHTIPETQQYIAGIPLQITPSPPAPQMQDSNMLPVDEGNTYSSINSSTQQNNLFSTYQDMSTGKVDIAPIKVHPIRSHQVIHGNYSAPTPQKFHNPWAQRHENTHCGREQVSNPYRVSTGYEGKDDSFYVEYTHYGENSSREVHTAQPNIINHHNIIQYQPRSLSATPEISGFHNQGW